MDSISTDIKYPRYCKPEIWGGIECTINRIGDIFRDQVQETGHYDRPDDIEQFATLGIRKIRYPVLWEHYQPSKDKIIDWSFATRQLNRLRELSIEPVVGLLHHGSGPAFTNMVDEYFAQHLAAYALAVAKQFPWLQYYTPVNEPLTTARFSGLYGHWYPHEHNETTFLRILINQLKAVVLSMRAIRVINPGAKLVQTEDLGKTHSTRVLAYQASFENRRRWLTYDLLCGKVDNKHSFWKRLLSFEITEKELAFFLENPCPPDIMGFNYYVTSERFLDHQIEYHPSSTHGGNGIHRYADTEAARSTTPAGLEKLLREAWNRYHRPLAITECHLSCTREEQLRWFKQTWDTCCDLCEKGIPVQGITAWALLGAFDWDSLLTDSRQHYESGVFDIRNLKPRPTALARLIQSLASTGNYSHPLLAETGWWNKHHINNTSITRPPVLITGCNGTLGQAFIKICERRSIPFVALSKQELNIANSQQIARSIDQHKPWAIINAAGYVRVDDAETNRAECFSVNTTGPVLLAKACQLHGIRLLNFSSDLVFDGTKKSPYDEHDPVNPLNIYGQSKAEAEKMVLAVNPQALIVRSSAFFGPWDRYNFVYTVLESLRKNIEVAVTNDVIVSPTYVPDLADAALDIFIDEETGVWHITNDGWLTWAEFGRLVAERGGCHTHQLLPKPAHEMDWKAFRPHYSVLQSAKGIQLPKLDNALNRYFEQKMV